MRAAERLMTDKGIDAVSLREVSVAAGQHNNSAVLYHFGSRDALIDAILERHSTPIQARWASQLDFIARNGVVGPRPLMQMLALDIVDKLDDPDGGWEYISICGQLLMAPHGPLIERAVGSTPIVQRLMAAMLSYCSAPPSIVPMRLERLLQLIYPSIIAWRRLERAGSPNVSRAVFASELVDTLVHTLQQPLSEQTAALLNAGKPAAQKAPRKGSK